MAAHSHFGGSVFRQRLNCAASFQETLRAPPSPTSVYAEEGVELHDEMAKLLQSPGALNIAKLNSRLESTTHLSIEHNLLLMQCLISIADLTVIYGGKWRIIAIERTYPFPGIIGSFGTCDLILSNGWIIIVIDFKFGGGVIVKCSYRDGDLVSLNEQLVFYTLSARKAHRRLFRGKRIVVAIIQPRADEPLDYTETDNDELDEWQVAANAAYLAALERNPEYVQGDWCRFASCKATCPLWIGALHELGDLDLTGAALTASVDKAPDKFGQFLGRAMTLKRYAEQWGTEIEQQAHRFAEDGGTVEGWRLVPKRATRQWLNEDDACAALRRIGAEDADIFTEPEFKSPAQVEKALKVRKLKLPPDLTIAVSSGNTLAPANDPRPNVANLNDALHELGPALKGLR